MYESFFRAIKSGNLEEVQRLLSLDPEQINTKENGVGPVLVAAYNRKMEIANFLAEKAGMLNIFEACAMGRNNQIMMHLARDHQLVNAYAEDGFQPLGLASFFGQLETVKLLVQAGALLNSSSKNILNASALQSAAATGEKNIVLYLLEKGADPNIRENSGYTPLHAAAQNGDVDIIRALLFNGADLQAVGDDGKKPIDMAMEKNHEEATRLLKQGITRRFRNMKPRLDNE